MNDAGSLLDGACSVNRGLRYGSRKTFTVPVSGSFMKRFWFYKVRKLVGSSVL